MPEYDPVNYPRPMADDLTHGEVGRDVPGPDPAGWPSSNVLPEQYAGPTPDREFETAPLGRNLTGRPPVNTPATTDGAEVMPSSVPPPGHTAQP